MHMYMYYNYTHQEYILPTPPACASMIAVATGVPGDSPSSSAAPALRPAPTAFPGTCTSVPNN